MSERETQNFMTVDSFSELPFLRPKPALDRSSDSSPSIRIFGIDLPHEPDYSSQEEPSKDHNTSTTDTGTTHKGTTNPITSHNNGGSGGENGRKFECHYCCRNFPTSQALGGHQNAHKRERQHAKRAHLQSAMAAHHHHHQHGLIADGHFYSLLGYHRLGSVPSAGRFETPPPPRYPSWNGSSTSVSPGTRIYGGLGTVSQPIDGSPLPGLWRVPVHSGAVSFGVIHRDRSMALPLFGGDDSTMVGIGGGGGMGSSYSSSSSSTSPQDRGGYESGAKETVSLDLHL